MGWFSKSTPKTFNEVMNSSGKGGDSYREPRDAHQEAMDRKASKERESNNGRAKGAND